MASMTKRQIEKMIHDTLDLRKGELDKVYSQRSTDRQHELELLRLLLIEAVDEKFPPRPREQNKLHRK